MIRAVWATLFCLMTLALPLRADDPTALKAVAPTDPVPMMINLSALADWNTQQPFIDRMKVARPWIGHFPGRWGGMAHHDLAAMGLLDDNGWPIRIPGELSSIGTLIMTDLPEAAQTLTGRYVLRFDGNGIVEVSGRAENVRYGANEVRFDFSPGPGGVEIKIQRSDRAGTGDYVRNISVIRTDRVAQYEAGALFNPDFIAVIEGFGGLRFMEWMKTNNSTLSHWDDRPRPGDYSYMWRGIPIELMMRLGAEVGADVWMTLPHQADDTYFRKAAQQTKDLMGPNMQVYVEYSNEVWNWGFEQAAWADAQAMARWGVEHQWMQFYGMRAAQMAMIWREVFTDTPDRLITVLSTQAGWLGLETQLLYAPLWQAEDPANPAPHSLFDTYAITGYVSARLGYEEKQALVRDWLTESENRARNAGLDQGLIGAALDSFVADHRYDHAFTLAGLELLDGRISGDPRASIADLMTRIFPHHRDVSAAHDLTLIMYEGGTHVVGVGPVVDDTELDMFFRALNYSDEMAAIYSHLISGWAAMTDGPFNVFNDVSRLSKWGSWGVLRHLGDSNPRWDTVVQFRKQPPQTD